MTKPGAQCFIAKVRRLVDSSTPRPRRTGSLNNNRSGGENRREEHESPCKERGELREHFAQFGHIRRCIVPFNKETGFHRGMGWIHFSSEEELQNVLQQESHIIDGVKVNVFLYINLCIN
ncbi:PREDICTED: SRA stem-loop-interacting RNA-binding protein, mitochondrial isoform X1 [Galeopterus variegatus]|uniref:SRA stem-loop-interacting RNA-binding protein, mitochondrial isoform X1 n=1 Tax=Galeopterus variegatus TaxID=482537 RepID=A0ABM0S6I6_GALVR|nr:PREDICTED: SRA stem-loop-interacting RNA-binding protein, mitochondrial isoform X1 [Galeopterus variegatus]